MGAAAWMTYLVTDDIYSTVIKAKALGTGVSVGNTDDPHIGWISVLEDPKGTVFEIRSQ